MDNFYGYGSWDARFWFIGHEEGGGEVPRKLQTKLITFKKLTPKRTAPFATSVSYTNTSGFGGKDLKRRV